MNTNEIGRKPMSTKSKKIIHDALTTFFVCCGILLVLIIHFHVFPITH